MLKRNEPNRSFLFYFSINNRNYIAKRKSLHRQFFVLFQRIRFPFPYQRTAVRARRYRNRPVLIIDFYRIFANRYNRTHPFVFAEIRLDGKRFIPNVRRVYAATKTSPKVNGTAPPSMTKRSAVFHIVHRIPFRAFFGRIEIFPNRGCAKP